MSDKLILESILLLLKSTTEVYVHASLESSNKTVHNTFKSCLDEILKLQFETFNKMNDYGYYKITNIDNKTIISSLRKLESK